MDLTHAQERLVAEFEGIFSPETVAECLQESAGSLEGKGADRDARTAPGGAIRSRATQSGCTVGRDDRQRGSGSPVRLCAQRRT